MALKIYGTPASRTFRTLWMANELGIKYENIPVDFRKGETRAPAHLKVNPNGHIPAIDDDGLVMWESLAINLYLAKKYGGAMALKSAQDEGLATQWSMWALTEAEPLIVTMLMHRVMLPEAQRSADTANKAAESLKPAMTVLNDALNGKQWLIGSQFTVADLNVSGVVSTSDPRSVAAAALTSALIDPRAEMADATTVLQAATSATSASMKTTRTPYFSISATAPAPFAAVLPTSAIARHPSATSWCATARPRPCAPPVMMARVSRLRCVRSSIISLFPSISRGSPSARRYASP